MNKRGQFRCPNCGEVKPLAHRMTIPGDDRCRVCAYGPEFRSVAEEVNAGEDDLAAKQRSLMANPLFKAAWAATFASKTEGE